MVNRGKGEIPLHNASAFLFALILFSIFYFLLPAPSAHAAWYDSTYDYCRELTMTAGGNSGGVATTTTKGFALVATSTISTLKTTGNGGNIQSTGTASGTTTPTDLIITNGTECNSDGGSTILDFYFEKYVATTGEFVLWVEPVDISSTSAKTVLMYYGKSGASDQSDEEGTFGTSGEVGVWNFHEDPSGSAPQMLDSTSNNNDGTSNGSMTSSDHVRGMSDGALQFEYDDYISRTHTASLALSTFTMSFWMRTNEFNDGTQTFMVQKYDYPNSGFVIADHGPFSQNIYFDWFNGSAGHTSFARSLVNDDNWHLITAKYDGSVGYLYLDGTLRSTDTHALTTDTTEPLNLGFQNGPNNDDNIMDDVRLYNRSLHAMDILTIYNNTRSSSIFWTFGSEETEVTTPSVTTNAATGVRSTSGTLNGDITSTGGQTGSGTQHGFAYSTDATLTTGVSTTTLGNYSGTGTFSSSLTSLTRGTKYYFRAYVTNVSGTAYGSIQNFRTFSTLSRPANNLGLVGYWPMNEATSTIAGDFSGQGNHGALSGYAWVSGKRGGAVELSGSGAVTVANSASINLGVTETIAFWVKGTPTAAFAGMVEKINFGVTGFAIVNADSPGNDDLYVRIDTSGGASQNCTAVPGITNVLDGTWHHVVVVIDNGTCAIYKDAVAGTGGTYTVGGGFAAPGSSLYFQDTGNFTTMSYDDVRIYNRALSETQVSYLYNVGAARLIASSKTLTNGTSLGSSNGLVGHWSFDGGDVRWTSETAGVAYDGSGSNIIGTLTSMIRASAATKGKIGQALTFDASDDLVDLGDNFDFAGSSFTVCAWARPTDSGNQGYVAGKYDAAGDNGFYLRRSPADSTQWTLGTNAAAGIDVGTVNLNTWQHLCGVVVPTPGTSILYENGVSVGSSTSFPATVDNVRSMVIGNRYDNARQFAGQIDDVRIYNRVLSAAEVKRLYQLGTTIIR